MATRSHKGAYDETLIVKKTAELFEERQRTSVRKIFNVAAPVLAVSLFWVCYEKSGKLCQARGPAEKHMARGNVVLGIFGILVSCFFMTFPSQPRRVVRIFINAMVFLSLSATTMMYQNSLQVVWDRPTVIFPRIITVLIIGPVQLSCLLNVCYLLLVCSVWTTLIKDDAPTKLLLGPSCWEWFILQEILITLALCSVAIVSEARLFTEVRATLEARASQNVQSAVTTLLHTIYDVVIQLDETLKMREGMEAMSCLLLHGHGKSLEGAQIQDFIDSEQDQVLFTEYVLNPNAVQCPSLPIRIWMRDSNAEKVYVEVLHTAFSDLDSQMHHLIGIRELERAFDGSSPEEFVDFDDINTSNFDDLKCSKNRICVASHSFGRKGTPSCQIRETFSDSSSIHSVGSNLTRLRVSGLEPTPVGIRALSLFKLILQWNIEFKQTFCCTFHSLLYEAMCTLRKLQKRQCIKTIDASWQCPRCKMLEESASEAGYDDADGYCQTCVGLEEHLLEELNAQIFPEPSRRAAKLRGQLSL